MPLAEAVFFQCSALTTRQRHFSLRVEYNAYVVLALRCDLGLSTIETHM